jgi:nitrogen fixation/metabolism regulation signal transduction histidine kinase
VKVRYRLTLYILVLHAALFAVAIYFFEQLGYAFFGIELLLIISITIALRFLNRALEPLEFVQNFSDMIGERDFSSRFRSIGQAEMDQLIGLYNDMLSQLYDERLKLGEQRGFLNQFLAATDIGVLLCDFEGNIALINKSGARLLGHDAEEVQNQTLQQVPGELAQSLREMDAGTSRILLLRSGRRVHCVHSTFRDRGFDRSYYVLEELTKTLQQTERSTYEKLIRMMSHEVNNTIAVTNSLLDSCLSYSPQISAEDRDDYESALRVVIKRNQHLNDFMGGFASIVRIPPPDVQKIDLAELMQNMADVFRSEFQERNIALDAAAIDAEMFVSADLNLMEQVLINILKNSMEAIDKSGVIRVEATREENLIRLSVFDSGAGISADVRDQLFTAFFTTKDQGQGVGLTLVSEILRAHGFDFWLGATDSNETCFSIWMAAA